MTTEKKVKRLEAFKELLRKWQDGHDELVRSTISRERKWVEREVLEARCLKAITISPPPAVGGLLMRDVNPFDLLFPLRSRVS